MHGGADLPEVPNEEQIETGLLFQDLHRPDHRGRCPNLTCAVGAVAPPWPCHRWRWSAEVLRRAGYSVPAPEPVVVLAP